MRGFVTFFSLIIFVSSLSNSCGQKNSAMQQDSDHQYTNKLINESSPYLLQHAHNPVDWYPWGEEALEKAKKENKLMVISIGYAACHWCHVMEKESFEDSAVAKLMNEKFISIKVDREERPDVDQIYMNAAQLLTGSGGWPLNAIALPDGRPIFAGTYFPKENWMNLLERVQEFYVNTPEKAEEQASRLTEGIQTVELISLNTSEETFTQEDLAVIFEGWKEMMDFKFGGQRGAPKFPVPIGHQFLLKYYHNSGDKKALEAVTTTLDKMALGGIYDQIGGGFARYSTDKYWKVPHFEKMLYDNAQLVSLYASAYQLTKDPLYKEVVYETLEFIKRELTSEENGFYSSLDADSEGEEGKFYIWKKPDIDKIIGADSDFIIDYYSIEEDGNWEHGNNILLREMKDEDFAEAHGLSVADLKEQVSKAKKLLLEARENKIRPGLDDKILTAWNALMIKGYADAYRVFDEETFLEMALKNAAFIKDKALSKNGQLTRNYKDGKASINAFLDDYAFTIEAFIALYQATFEEQWLFEAEKLLKYSLDHFFDEASGMFFYTSDLDPDLIARKMEVADNVIPSSNSAMAKNLYILGEYLYNEDYISKARQMLNNVKDKLNEGGPYYGNWDIVMSYFVNQPYEVAIVGDDFEAKRKAMDQHFLPNVLFMGGKNEGKLPLLENKLVEGRTTIYVCQNKSCRLPVTEVDRALTQIK
ncbi:thioredoxin domain-containing protein [Fulvivirgaceae bacterium BMA10]|uniref:Thioredoxin domain-containing protein n=1 Tax=Splendidivirga corallicola TaxID=3051826 RepID=A0ABT8KHC1_9BACT|nr:thioredoxin domain-containing protein [Fulvivirgaceae bacterium BMA10]